MTHIANHRYVVIGKRTEGGHDMYGPIHATDEWSDAEDVLRDGLDVDGKHWRGVRIHDRRTEGIVPIVGWFKAPVEA